LALGCRPPAVGLVLHLEYSGDCRSTHRQYESTAAVFVLSRAARRDFCDQVGSVSAATLRTVRSD
jgi:hypothetical protein